MGRLDGSRERSLAATIGRSSQDGLAARFDDFLEDFWKSSSSAMSERVLSGVFSRPSLGLAGLNACLGFSWPWAATGDLGAFEAAGFYFALEGIKLGLPAWS